MGSFQTAVINFINNKFGGFSKNVSIIKIVKFVMILLLMIIFLYLGCWIYLFHLNPAITLLTELRAFIALALGGTTITAFVALLKLLVDTDGDGIPQELEDNNPTTSNKDKIPRMSIPLPDNKEITIKQKDPD